MKNLLLLSSLLGGFTPLTTALLESRATGFQLVTSKQLEGSTLNSNCQQVLQQTIQCDEYVANFRERGYRGSLDSSALTDSVCQATCERSLLNARRRLAAVCASTPDLMPGYPVATLIETTIAGWNETCLKDKDTGKYCNDIIDAFEDYESLEAMPNAQLCSYCYGAKLRMMQQSPYSSYDELFAQTLETVNKRCNVKGPTDTLPPPINVNVTKPSECSSKQTYKTRDGDTCDSIALANSVSAASLFFLNPDLLNCSSVPAGLQLCLPEKCSELYTVKNKDEDCVVIGVQHGTSWAKLVKWNLALKDNCRNIYGTDPFWGRVICVSQPGGEYTDPGSGGTTPGNGDIGGEGGSGDGYASHVVPAPEGAQVAEGTTKNCGRYIQAEKGVSCPSLLAKRAMPMDLFLKINPSLGSIAECDGKVVPGLWYCLNPVHGWEQVSS
ncbi:LysM domain protein [Metarhizium acridum CQMa 102]|uniref:LysM domain protein n=2 Tax=Metarhizium acridum TaxID=92637 RepID=E9E8A4_METAQ|nr:LysM domain protein [Metarhizium acridum CQMa 102]EFY87854.1 LysM domain protein [Metarhizium acridum CQMa 102]